MAYQDNDNKGGFERKMYQGDWKCSKCSTKITELPFEPDPARLDQLKCKECYRKDRPPRRDRY